MCEVVERLGLISVFGLCVIVFNSDFFFVNCVLEFDSQFSNIFIRGFYVQDG